MRKSTYFMILVIFFYDFSHVFKYGIVILVLINLFQYYTMHSLSIYTANKHVKYYPLQKNITTDYSICLG